MIIKIPPQERRRVVFDLDDVGWGLVRRVSNMLGIPYEDLNEFHTLENELLTPEQRQAVIACYSNPEVFRNINFFEGFERMMELEEYGARSELNTNSFSSDIVNIKKPQVVRKLPAMPLERMRFGIVNERTTLKKDFGDNIYVAIDDSPYNIAKSVARHNIVPRRPWNQTAKALQMVKDKSVHYVDSDGDMQPIYDKIIQLLRL